MQKQEMKQRLSRYFNDRKMMEAWLETPIPSLGSNRPSVLLESKTGREQLREYLSDIFVS